MRLVTVSDLEEEDISVLFRALHATQACSDLNVMPIRCLRMTTGESFQQSQAQFKVRTTNLNNIIKVLNARGFDKFDVCAVLSTTVRVPDGQVQSSSHSSPRWLSWFPSRIGATRLSTLEMHTNICSNTFFSFDHALLILIACGLAAHGLTMDASVSILAAFFVSPLMHMILGSAWGFVIRDGQLVRRCVGNILLGACMAWVFGICIGLAVTNEMFMSWVWQKGQTTINSSQILSRGPPASVTLGSTALTASFSGITMALGQSTGIASALAGVTLSASLLPPLVNSGMCCVLGFAWPSIRTEYGDSLHAVSLVSFGIYIVAVPSVILFSFLAFKFKHIGGQSLLVSNADNEQTLAALGVVIVKAASDPSPFGGSALNLSGSFALNQRSLTWNEQSLTRSRISTM